MSRPIVYLAFAAALFGSTGAAVAQEATAPVHHAHGHHHRAMSHGQAIAPLPPAAGTRVADRTTPAPVPNESVSPPDPPAPAAQLAPSSFQLHYPPVGDGYVRGSSSQAMDDREAAKATGVLATVPLSQ